MNTNALATAAAELASLIAYLTKQRSEALAISAAADDAVRSAPVDSAERTAAWHVAQAAEDSLFAAHDALLIARRVAASLASL